jgi:hypothetical protein
MMGWVRIDDTHGDHPKLVAAGPYAELLDIRAICWSARFETDGRVPRAALVQIGRGIPRAVVHANKLVKVGRWRATKQGWVIGGYLDMQPSKADRESERARARDYRARAKAAREGRARGTTEQNGRNIKAAAIFEPEPAATNGDRARSKRQIRAAKTKLTGDPQ